MNKHATMRLARQGCIHQFHAHPSDVVLTPEELAADAIASLENRERYLKQSRGTVDGEAGLLPRRNPLKLFVNPYWPDKTDPNEPDLPHGWTAPNTPDDF